MTRPALVTPEEFLRTSFENPAREYADGQVIERPSGNFSHSEIQAKLLEIFFARRKKAPLFAYPELRLRLSASQFRIPDVAVFSQTQTCGTGALASVVYCNRDYLAGRSAQRHNGKARALSQLGRGACVGGRSTITENVDVWERRIERYRKIRSS